ncbi:MAG TPA: hypothetical protein VFG01_03055, partial [Acidobacteriota bacterium]|nr:hypothetical protein [Acidobacteriota bacterium]
NFSEGDKMKKKVLISLLSVILVIQTYLLFSQFTPKEIANRAEWEDFLKTAEIMRSEDIGEGVTKPYRLYLKKGDVKNSGCWKNPSGIQKGFLEGWQYEIAAYEMDKLLDLHMIPPTVEREFNGKRGSLQLWITSEMSDLDRMEEGIDIPKSHVLSWNRRKYLMRAFDCLIANEDRTQQNIRYTKDWRMILIDHSRSFRSKRKYTRNLLYGKDGIKEKKMIRQLPREFILKLKSLNFEVIKQAVGPYLTDKEIQAVLKRRDLLLKEIEEMIKAVGENKFLY